MEHIACASHLDDRGNQPIPLLGQRGSGKDPHLTPLHALAFMVKLPMATLRGGLTSKRLRLFQQLRLVAFDLNDEMVARASGDLESFF